MTSKAERDYIDGIRLGEEWASVHAAPAQLYRLREFKAGFGDDENAWAGWFMDGGVDAKLAAVIESDVECGDFWAGVLAGAPGHQGGERSYCWVRGFAEGAVGEPAADAT